MEQAFGVVVRDLRKQAGWSQERLADASRTTRGYISLVERGVNSVTVDMIFRLARSLNTTPAALFAKVETELGESSSAERE